MPEAIFILPSNDVILESSVLKLSWFCGLGSYVVSGFARGGLDHCNLELLSPLKKV